MWKKCRLSLKIVLIIVLIATCYFNFLMYFPFKSSPTSNFDGDDSQVRVVYIHGFLEEERDKTFEIETLKTIFPVAESFEVKRWDASTLSIEILGEWYKALDNASKTATQLFEEIRAMSTEERKKLVIVGHSLGGRITVLAMAMCAKERIKIKQFILLGAAIDNDAPEIELALRASIETPLSFVNCDDALLSMYRVAQDAPALGTGYAKIMPQKRLIEVPCEKQGMKHKSNHYVKSFSNLVQKVRAGKEVEIGIVVPQDCGNLEWGTTDKKVWWSVLMSCNGWQLQRHNVTGHCRILDPDGTRRAWGSRSRLEASFEKVVYQLTGKILSKCWGLPNGVVEYVEVPQDDPNMNLKVMDAGIWWDVLATYEGWKLEENKTTSHCRILSPNKTRRSWGKKTRMIEAFQSVCKEIDAGKTSVWE